MLSRPSTITSRRTRNSATMSSIGFHGPSRAATAASWLKAEVQETEFTINRVTGSTSSGGNTPKPNRQPVMAKGLDHPSSRTVRSGMPSKSRTLQCFPS